MILQSESVMQNPIAAVLIYISQKDYSDAFRWYQSAFPQAIKIECLEADFIYLDVSGVALEIVTADEKISSGVAGSVTYWSCDDFHRRLDFLLGIGATLFRDPLVIEGGMKMCQVKDPWGNAIGIRGPAPPAIG